MVFKQTPVICSVGVAAALLAALPAQAAPQVEIYMPLGRSVYQTNEMIDISVVRSDTAALAASPLTLTLTGADASKLSLTFNAPAVALSGANARTTDHLHLNASYLRPGNYTMDVGANGATATSKAPLEIYSSIRKSDFVTLGWGARANGKDRWREGFDGTGYTTVLGNADPDADYIKGGIDYMPVCTMGGGHQMDLQSTEDWSDPYVIRGGTARVVRQAFIERTHGNCIGIHFYDEPGLTWLPDPGNNNLATPHWIPSQHTSYENAFGHDVVRYNKIDTANAADVQSWKHWANWKLAFMDAAWKDSIFGVNFVRPDWLTATQSQYGWSAPTDGYGFTVARDFPLISGHGGYDDLTQGYLTPSWFLEQARARERAKPNWYLPGWYGNTTNDRFRGEQYLSFMQGIQGLATPPDIDPFAPDTKMQADAVYASNKLMGRLGTIFVNREPTNTQVAMLYSLSNFFDEQAHDPNNVQYSHATKHVMTESYIYLAGMMMQQPIAAVVDQDVVDGTLESTYKAVVVPSVTYLDPAVVSALERFIQHGGVVYTTPDSKVAIKGATDLGVTPQLPDQALIDKIMADPKTPEPKWKAVTQYGTLDKQLAAGKVAADALKPALAKAGIKPLFESDAPMIAAREQVSGDVDYMLAVNATFDDTNKLDLNRMKPVAANISLNNGGRSVYDAVFGGKVREFNGGNAGKISFGPGAMRVFAMTARPIGGVKQSPPMVASQHVDVNATVVDTAGGVLGGNIPLEISLVDSLGSTRYDLYRATHEGALHLSLPLALNDPAGTYRVTVRELLNNSANTASFAYRPSPAPSAMGMQTAAAVIFGNDRDNIARFARLHKKVTIAVGKNDFDSAAAATIKMSLDGAGIASTLVNAADIAKPRPLTPDQLHTWVGWDPGLARSEGAATPSRLGFNVMGPVILVGVPEDNDIIKLGQTGKFYPYNYVPASFPGAGRGYLSWQYYLVGHQQESVTISGYDAAGLQQAAATFSQIINGKNALQAPPLLTAAAKATVVPATADPLHIAAPVVDWSTPLPDWAVSMSADGNSVVVSTYDGTTSTLSPTGAVTASVASPTVAPADPAKPAPLPAAPKPSADLAKVLRPDRVVKRIATTGGLTAIGYWGGLLQIYKADNTLAAQWQFPQDISQLAAAGGKFVVATAEGRVTALHVK